MFDSYIKELEATDARHKKDHTQPEYPQEVAQTLVILYKSVAALNDFITVKLRDPETKMYPRLLKAVLVPFLENVESTTQALKVMRTSGDSGQVPVGINKHLARLNRVGVDVANATIYADKEERLTRRELMQIYRDSFPYTDFKQALEAHVEVARAARLKVRMHHMDLGNGEAETVRKNAASPFAHQKSNTEVEKDLREQANQRAHRAANSNLGRAIKAYARYHSNLPTSLRGLPFKAFRMPIIPNFQDIGLQIDIESKLKLLGFKVKMLSDAFPVIEDQFLIAFDHKQMEIDSGVRKDKDGNFRVMRKTGPKEKIAANEATDKLLAVLESINEKSHERYALGSTMFIPNPRNPKLWLAWVVRENQRKGLAQMTSTIEAGWGLPMSGMDKMTVEDD
jgi:hypothetical protein